MLAMRTHIVLPTKLEWLALFLMIGFHGFFAQVLMTMGLQRQAVGRSTMAVYIQVRILCNCCSSPTRGC